MPENGQENGVNGASAEKRKAEAGDGDSGAKKEKLEGGTLLFSGATDWKLVGRKTNEIGKSGNTQWTPVRLAALRDVNIVGVNKGCSSAFCLVIDEEGQVWAWGRNEGGQLGLGHMKDLLVPTLVQDLTGYNIVEIATGKAHALFLTSCGKVLAAGENEKGQCGQGKKTPNLETPKLISHEGPDIVSVAAGPSSVSCWTRRGRSGPSDTRRTGPSATMTTASSYPGPTRWTSGASTAPSRCPSGWTRTPRRRR